MAKKQAKNIQNIDTVRASRGGHTFHERWAARRALQLVFPQDGLTAIAVEGLSTNELAKFDQEAEDIADLVLYYGGNKFSNSTIIQTTQFKYKISTGDITASYLKKTIEKFASSIIEYDKNFTSTKVDKKISFSFITNAKLSSELSEAIVCLKAGNKPTEAEALRQFKYLSNLCKKKGIEPHRLFSRMELRAAEADLPAQNNKLRRTIADWSAGADNRALSRLFELTELMREKAGPRGQDNNLVKREDVLNALNCEPEDLFPAETRFVKVGEIVARAQLGDVISLIKKSENPVFIHAEGGVGKTVFVENLATTMLDNYEVIVFDCFGGGAYRSPDQARHRPDVGFVQIINELASRGLCDPLLPGEMDSMAILNTARRRFSQAVSTIRSQSNKQGILIVIDAADNAQLEADNRKDDAFPSLLLASLDNERIDGLKLVLTARTHRMADVIERSKVTPFLLTPFIADEARLFLSSRRTDVSSVEFAIAFSRSRGNARVLAYLVDTWDINVVAGTTNSTITVEELIAQKCQKIFSDLHVAGWPDDDVKEFFAAISLLPPPIPLDELASALGWENNQVKSAASDLAPMLELVPHGAIFRDEPTETYVRDTYSNETMAQQAIAQRLENAQEFSSYAAEALPNFLVAINDSERSYALANSPKFPSTIQSDFGRRRLQLARLNAAFKLAVKEDDLDRALKLTMRLAQVAAANSRGDEFIRRSPSLAVALGDPDAYRRLFVDRSGWRGARDARLIIAHAFSGEMKEAEIHSDRAIGWINWYAKLPKNEHGHFEQGSGPEIEDFAAILFFSIIRGNYKSVDGNLAGWHRRFALAVCRAALKLARQFEYVTGSDLIDDLAEFAGTSKCKSFALKIGLLKSSMLSSQRRKALAHSLSKSPRDKGGGDNGYDPDKGEDADVIYASFAALLHDDATASAKILLSAKPLRPSSYDYGERHGFTRVWLPVLRVCCLAWAHSRKVAIYDLLPCEVKITAKVKAIESFDELRKFLLTLPSLRQKDHEGKSLKKTKERLFNDRQCKEISKAIENILRVISPIETAIHSGTTLTAQAFANVLSTWEQLLPSTDYDHTEEAYVLIRRTIGFGFVRLLMLHSTNLTKADVEKLIQIISKKPFRLSERSSILALIASKFGLETLAGDFASKIAEDIRKDDYIEQRGEDYAALAEALLEMSIPEARQYYRDGLAELDKLGSNDYELIYELLGYAAAQQGGYIQPILAHRLLNLSQTICHHEPSKFAWTLLGKACAASVGTSAITKLVRWDDQEVAEFSYGLPQLVCFLTAKRKLDPKKAAAILLLCEDHGWYDWRIGDGLRDLLRATPTNDERQTIFNVIVEKLKKEHSAGGWPSVWKSLLEIATEFPGLVNNDETASLDKLLSNAQRNQDEANARSSSISSSDEHSFVKPKQEIDPNILIDEMVKKCDPASASDIDNAARFFEADKSLPYYTKRTFFEKLHDTCPYNKRVAHLLALSEASTIEIHEAINLIATGVAAWSPSSAHVRAEAKHIIIHLFEQKGSELFNLRYSNAIRDIKQLTDICGDRGFVIRQILNTIVREKLELDGKEWLQIATSLCTETSLSASREALEDFLSGPAAGIADDIGEGGYKSQFSNEGGSLIAEIYFHLLGDSDAYIRWSVARSISWLAELDLIGDLDALLDCFDLQTIPALVSPDQQLAFENSQQWLLMGLARATLHHKEKLEALRPKLLKLATRPDIHILNKHHILRCLKNLGTQEQDIAALKQEVNIDPKGIVLASGWPKHTDAKSGFKFDYEFMKHEASQLARLFWISDGESTDAIALEIRRKWPAATNMDYFPGHDRYRRDRSDRYEFYRESIQKHALLSAATTLRKSRPVAQQNHDEETSSPFDEFIRDYDITFPDGSWLADHKDETPPSAKTLFMAPRVGKHETLIDIDLLLKQLTLKDSGKMIPIYGSWRSPDGVYIKIVTGLGKQRGIIGKCEAFSKYTDHKLWIPTLWHGGYDNEHRQESLFEPFIWAQDSYGLGVDAGDQRAARGVASRPRLGVELTTNLGLITDGEAREWKTNDDELALRSQVWGEWKPNPDDYRSHQNDDGEILWASTDWLDRVLPSLGQQLVYEIRLTKYKERHSYSEASGAKAVYVATRNAKSGLRVWHCKKASAERY